MCYIEAYEKFHQTCTDSEIVLGVRLFPDEWTTCVLVSLGHTLNFIDIWLKSFDNIVLGEQLCTEIKWVSFTRRFLLLF